MARKVTLKIEAEITILVEEGIEMDELELDIVSDNDNVDVEDFLLIKTEVTNSR